MIKDKTDKKIKVSINHFEHGAGVLTSKKGMYFSLCKYYNDDNNKLYKIIPKTFVLCGNKIVYINYYRIKNMKILQKNLNIMRIIV